MSGGGFYGFYGDRIPDLATANFQICKKGRSGIANIGNSCYLGTAVQILSHIPDIAYHFLSGDYKKKSGELTQSLSDVIHKLWLGSSDGVDPSVFKRILSHKSVQFDNTDQQDCHECLNSIISSVCEESRVISDSYHEHTHQRTQPLTVLSQQIIEDEWNEEYRRNSSFFFSIFHGLQVTRSTCSVCHSSSYRFENYGILSLSLPECEMSLSVNILPLKCSVSYPQLDYGAPYGNSDFRSTTVFCMGNASFGEFVNRLSQKIDVPASNILLCSSDDGRKMIPVNPSDEVNSTISPHCRYYAYIFNSDVSKSSGHIFIYPAYLKPSRYGVDRVSLGGIPFVLSVGHINLRKCIDVLLTMCSNDVLRERESIMHSLKSFLGKRRRYGQSNTRDTPFYSDSSNHHSSSPFGPGTQGSYFDGFNHEKSRGDSFHDGSRGYDVTTEVSSYPRDLKDHEHQTEQYHREPNGYDRSVEYNTQYFQHNSPVSTIHEFEKHGTNPTQDKGPNETLNGSRIVRYMSAERLLMDSPTSLCDESVSERVDRGCVKGNWGIESVGSKNGCRSARNGLPGGGFWDKIGGWFSKGESSKYPTDEMGDKEFEEYLKRSNPESMDSVVVGDASHRTNNTHMAHGSVSIDELDDFPIVDLGHVLRKDFDIREVINSRSSLESFGERPIDSVFNWKDGYCTLAIICGSSRDDGSGNMSKAIEPLSASAFIHQSKDLKIDFAQNQNSEKKKVPLKQCFDLYSIANEYELECDTCNRKQPIERCSMLVKCPPILIIHLQRFAYVGGSYGRMLKVDTFVDFPETDLDITQMLMAPGDFDGNQAHLNNVYDLMVVCNHAGDANGGHYYSYACDTNDGNRRWFSYDDDKVTYMDESTSIVSEKAYILVYGRKDTQLDSHAVVERLLETRAHQDRA